VRQQLLVQPKLDPTISAPLFEWQRRAIESVEFDYARLATIPDDRPESVDY
jgi:hypothetical protein